MPERLNVPRRFVSVLAWGLALACTACAFVYQQPSITDLRTYVLAQLEHDTRPVTALDGLNTRPELLDAVRRFTADLLDEPAVAAAHQDWLRTAPGVTGNDVLQQWWPQYAKTLSSGLLSLDDEEIALLADTSVLHSPGPHDPPCRLAETGVRRAGIAAPAGLSPAQLNQQLRVFKRAYTAALAQAPVRPLPPPEEVRHALFEGMRSLPPSERWWAEKSLSGNSLGYSASGCTSGRLMVILLTGAPAHKQAWMRRYLVITALREVLGTQAPVIFNTPLTQTPQAPGQPLASSSSRAAYSL
ncbi:MAG: hypothetical protein ABI605_20925 [Rhizobacter sp.]